MTSGATPSASGGGAFGVLGILNRVNAQAAPARPNHPTSEPSTPEFTIVDDGGPDGSQAPRRISYGGTATHHRDPLRESRGSQPRLASGRPRRGSGHHNTADDILPHLVKEIYAVDIRPLGDNDYSTVYRIWMKDGTMRMMTYTLIDEHGLRPFADAFWRTARMTPLQTAAYRSGCY